MDVNQEMFSWQLYPLREEKTLLKLVITQDRTKERFHFQDNEILSKLKFQSKMMILKLYNACKF